MSTKTLIAFFIFRSFYEISCEFDYPAITPLHFKQKPAPDGHRCGVCPTFFRKICGFDMTTNATYIFDNHCMLDLYNCIQGTKFSPLKYVHCIHFGNFAYVHGYKYEDMDYGESQMFMTGSKKHPDFVRV